MAKPERPKAKTGRKSDYSEELAASICAQLAEGKSLNAICAQEGMPKKTAVYMWLIRHPTFAEMYTRAREDQAETLADDIVSIADSAGAEDVNVARLRVDARKWVAAKLKPRKYGDRLTNEHSGPQGGPIENKYTVEFINAARSNKPEV